MFTVYGDSIALVFLTGMFALAGRAPITSGERAQQVPVRGSRQATFARWLFLVHGTGTVSTWVKARRAYTHVISTARPECGRERAGRARQDADRCVIARHHERHRESAQSHAPKRNVKRSMVLRWVAAGVLEAAKGFRHVKGSLTGGESSSPKPWKCSGHPLRQNGHSVPCYRIEDDGFGNKPAATCV